MKCKHCGGKIAQYEDGYPYHHIDSGHQYCMTTQADPDIRQSLTTEPSSPEPTNTLETQCYICPKCGDDHLSSMPCEQNAPEQSGVEWLEVDAIKDDEGIYACLFQLQQVCTEQADRIAALEADNKRIVIMVESMNEVILKGGE